MTGPAGWARAASACVALGVAALWLVWSPLDANDVVGGDEGYYGTLARNMLADRGQWLSPSLVPLGPPGDKPPLYPGLLALTVAAGGPTAGALRWPSVVFAVLIALGVGVLADRAVAGAGAGPAPWIGPAAALLLMTLPWFGDASRSAMSDIPMAAVGIAALVAVTGGPPTVRRSLAAGALLGLAFQCKLWLAGVFVLPALAASWAGARGTLRGPVMLLVAAALVGASHLVAVALLEPGQLGHWLDVYWRRMLVERVSDTASGFARPPSYYALLLAHALVLILPLAGLGLDRLRSRWREPAALAVIAGCGAFLALSAFTVKSAVYLYALLPAWVVAAAVGAAAIASRTARPGILTIVLVLAGLPAVARGMGAGGAGGAEPPPLAAWAGAWLVTGATLLIAGARPAWSRPLAVGLCALAIAGGLARQSRRLPVRYHDPGYRAVAASLAPRLGPGAPARPAFVAPEAPAFAYHLFRAGRYWGTPLEPWTAQRREAIERDTTLRAFVIDPAQTTYGGWPDSTTLAWLESDTHEITREIETQARRRIGVRVFVRRQRR